MVTYPQMLSRATSHVDAARRQAAADVERAEATAADAKRAAVEPRKASRAVPSDPQLRAAADAAADEAAQAGRMVASVREAGDAAVASAEREVEMLRFEEACDHWVTLVSAPAEELPAGLMDRHLMALAGRDGYMAAALHLHRDGVPIPDGWRSPNGATVNAFHLHHSPGPHPS